MAAPQIDDVDKAERLFELIDNALTLISDSEICDSQQSTTASSIGMRPSLLEQCIELCNEESAIETEPVRTLHHLACTGGTLFAKCLAAMPNILLLNEVDPLSTMSLDLDNPGFSPSNLIFLLRQALPTVSDELLVELFGSDLEVIKKAAQLMGKRLLLRDHSSSCYLFNVSPKSRKSVFEIVSEQHPTLSVVTVRDPVDSYLSMRKHGWLTFTPATLDEYCRRYQVFLDDLSELPLFRYEDLIENPKAILSRICDALDLAYSPTFLETFSAFKLSGDSGRTGNTIRARSRRPFKQRFSKLAQESTHYRLLADRLGYDLLFNV